MAAKTDGNIKARAEYQGTKDWRFDLIDYRDSCGTCPKVASVLLMGGFWTSLQKGRRL